MHDMGRVISLLMDKVSMLHAKVRDLKIRAGPKAVAATEKWAADLHTEVVRLKAELGEAEQHYKDLQKEADGYCSQLKELRGKMLGMEDELLKLT
ncbi:hypothetical protein B296_00023603 [Ensete ventricosum]|uniref:Uncharacterized protein n=1 Tax=Ensete ventricosum TaxID=4639 RepID=A0A427ANM8_ENSVE|nr:hypothetical protein B296_00023603 [Ensete ventricosum]